MQNKQPQWSAMLADAVNKPGVLSRAYSAFHDYSVGNQMLAWSQMTARDIPLGPVATYKDWLALGRQVRKGEKAIELVMPVTIKRRDDSGEKTDDTFTVFSLKPRWFALSQTDGEDYVHEAKTPAWDAAKALAALGITEEPYKSTDGNCQGYASGTTIAINPVAALPHRAPINVFVEGVPNASRSSSAAVTSTRSSELSTPSESSRGCRKPAR